MIAQDYLKLLGIEPRLFHKINKDLELFIDTGMYSHEQGLAKAYIPTSNINHLLKGYSQFLTSGKQESIAKPKLSKSKQIISQGNTKVNLEALESLNDKFERCNDHIRLYQCSQLIIEAKSNDGYLLGFYGKAKSGRLYGLGVTLQNMHKEIRDAALSQQGLYDYDIENCQPTLFYHFYKGNVLDLYIKNKKDMRKDLSEWVGVSEDLIKRCLIALFFGAQTNGYESSIVEYLGAEKAKVFTECGLIKSLNKELKEARKAVLDSERGQKALGLLSAKDLKNMSYNQKIAHILQNFESQILNVWMQNYNLEVLMHDGANSYQDIDTQELSSLILKETGFKVSFSKKLMP